MTMENEAQETEVKVEEDVLSISKSSLPKLNISTDATNNTAEWESWWQQLDLLILATGLENATEKRKIAIMLHSIGSKGLEIYNSFNMDMNSTTLAEVKEKFDEYFDPEKNLTLIRHKFFSRKQNPSESIDEFVTDLENLSTNCEFDSLKSSLIRDILIANMCSSLSHVRQRLLQEPNLTLEKAIEMAKNILSDPQNSDETIKDSASSVSDKNQQRDREFRPARTRYLGRSNNGETRRFFPNPRNKYNYQSSQNQNSRYNEYQPGTDRCGRCGQRHRFKCPAATVQCLNCFLFGHFAKYCFKNKTFQ